MGTLDDYTDEEIGQMIRQAAQGREQQAEEAFRSQNSLVKFLRWAGLGQLAALVESAIWAYQKVKDLFNYLFG